MSLHNLLVLAGKYELDGNTGQQKEDNLLSSKGQVLKVWYLIITYWLLYKYYSSWDCTITAEKNAKNINTENQFVFGNSHIKLVGNSTASEMVQH